MNHVPNSPGSLAHLKETRADLLWKARPGTPAALRWWVRENRLPFGFFFVTALVLGFGLLPFLTPTIPAEWSWRQWIFFNWPLWIGVIVAAAVLIFTRATPFDLGFTGTRALPRKLGAALGSVEGAAPDTPTVWPEVRFTLVAAVVLGLMYLGVAVLLNFVMPEEIVGSVGSHVRWHADGTWEWTMPVVLAFAMVVSAPIGEEILFRSFVYGAFRREYGPGLGALLSAVVFALMHAVFHYEGLAHLNHFFGGLVFAFAYERTGSIYPGMVLHMLGNGSLIVLAVLPINLAG